MEPSSYRFIYLLKMLPWSVVLATLGTFIIGYIYKAYEIAFNWKSAFIGVAVGILSGIAAGVVNSAAVGLFVGVADGVVVAAVIGVLAGVADDVVDGAVIIGMIGVAFGVAAIVALVVSIFVDAGLAAGMPAVVATVVATITVVGVAADWVTSLMTVVVAFWLTYFRIVTYPFDIALSTVTYLIARQRPHVTAQAWRWSPVAWHELIWLPLPFVSRLLVLMVRQDRKAGFKEIAFVAAKRRRQRRAALAALVEVAVNDLKVGLLASLSDITERLNYEVELKVYAALMRLSDVPERLIWTTDASAELPEELAAALARFDRAAQHVGQYLTLNSPYRQREALARALSETESLRRSLIVSSGRYAPRLLQVANEWGRLLYVESEKVRDLTSAAREIPNPFVSGNAIAETEQNVFTGRRDIVRQIEASVLGAMQTPTLLLHGPRRMGKTSILNQLPRLLGPDFAPTVVDCQNPAVTESAGTLLRYLSRKLSEGLRRRRVAVEPLTAAALAQEPFAVFDEWLEALERTLPSGMRALLCLDEYERLQVTLDAGWGGSFLNALRHTLQHRPRVVLMFTGAHTFQELGPAWTDRFISARRVRVSFLTREEVLPLLTRPIPEFDMTYAAGALDALFAATAGQPFLTQATAFELVQLLNEQQRKEATPEDVEEAQARALVSGGEYFANVWSDAGAEGQAILRAIVRGESPPDFPGARVWLREHDVLTDAGEFAVPLVRRWVREKVRG